MQHENHPKRLLNSMHFDYKYLVYVVMILLTIKFTITMLVYQTITVFGFTASLSIFLMPLWFFMLDVITEIYGYQIAKRLIICALMCQFMFTFACAVSVKLSITNSGTAHLFSVLPRVAIASLVGSICGSLLNSYLLEKYKIIFNGKYFILRCFCASIIGELIYTVITDSVAFIGIKPYSIIMQLITTSLIVKFITNPLMIIPTIIFSKILSKAESNYME